jgi:hypothetical protein
MSRPIKSVFPLKLKTIDQFSDINTPMTYKSWKKKKIIHFFFLYLYLDVKKRPANEKCEVAAIGAEITEVSFPITKIHTGIFL